MAARKLTDRQGTTDDAWNIGGVGGPRLQRSAAELEARTFDGSSLTPLSVGAPSGNAHALTLATGLRPAFVPIFGGTALWTAMPALTTPLFGGVLTASPMIQFDLTLYRTMRFQMMLLGALGLAGAKANVRFSANGSSGWLYADGSDATGELAAQAGVIAIDAQGTRVSAQITLHASVKARMYAQVVGVGGNAIIAPLIGPTGVELT